MNKHLNLNYNLNIKKLQLILNLSLNIICFDNIENLNWDLVFYHQLYQSFSLNKSHKFKELARWNIF